ncbi:MAG TPA: imidazole glycerol phosphate synthase subunit HisF [Clostridiales bacterium]|nr:imidazole glycerol phosphate synthase subunit HisF [Clostridiales bacterium]
MLTKRLIACFDIKNGMVTKAHKFQDNINVGRAEDIACKIYQDQIDEIIFYDITASSEKRKIDIETVKNVAKHVFVPFTVGGGIKNLENMYEVLKAGAEKISVDSMAVRNPEIIREGAKAFGSQCIVLSMQVKRVEKTDKIPSGYEIMIDGARVATGMDAVEWAKRGEELGAGEICVNSIDRDGTHAGYDIEITSMISNAVNIPVIASGGAGTPEHVAEAFTKTGASAAIISSMLYSPRLERNYTVKEIKQKLIDCGVPVRPWIENYNCI